EATINVLVKKTEVIVESLTATPVDVTVAPGKSVPISIVANMSDGSTKNVTTDSKTKYESSDSRIVVSGGNIVASNLAPDGMTGTVKVTYGGKEATINVLVKKTEVIVESLTATPVDVTVAPGKSVPISIVANMSDGSTKNVTTDSTTKYVSSDSKIVVSGGSIVASNLAPDGLTGTVKVTYGGKEATINVLVKKTEVIVESLTATPVDVTVAPGKSVPISIVANMSDGSTKNVTTDSTTKYVSSDSKIVVSGGSIVASNLAPDGLTGTVKVTYGGKEATINVLVKKTGVTVESLTATPVDVTVAPGKSVPISIVANMSDGSTKNVTTDSTTKYVSSDSKIVVSGGSIVASNLAPDGLTGTVKVTYGGKEVTINVLVKK
ncbi:Ig-like domain-containing protein, partial [[Anoxybacillus] calidus]|uniref:Ig-like domain-containing protein n=1 Tax=[Anoxybacillus] calidus TaxID=575178 RepID=UPI001C67439E